MKNEPKTLQEAICYFADADNCLDYIVARRWPNGVVCPTCGSDKVSFVPSRRCGMQDSIPSVSFRSRWEPSLRIPPIRSTSGSPPCGWSPTARTALVLGRFTALSASLKNPHGSCCTASACAARTSSTVKLAVLAAKSKWTKPSSAARLATCTRTATRRRQDCALAPTDKAAVIGIAGARRGSARCGRSESSQRSTSRRDSEARRTGKRRLYR